MYRPALYHVGENVLREGQKHGYVSVIIPVYNEAPLLERLCEAVRDSPVPKEVIIVDDGSSDGTREELAGMPVGDDLMIIFHKDNCGKGAAIRTGLLYARGEYVLIQDADLEYDPRDYPALLRPLQEGWANVVYGVRADRPERGLVFFLGAKLLTRVVNLLYGARIRDEATCYKAFRRSLLQSIPLECRRFEFCPEVTAKLLRRGESIAEVPITYTPRTKNQGKKLGIVDGLEAIWTLLRLRFVSRHRLMRAADAAAEPPFAVDIVRPAQEGVRRAARATDSSPASDRGRPDKSGAHPPRC